MDLTLSNPTQCSFEYSPLILDAMKDPRNLIYEPHSLGHPEARKAVADYLGSKGQKIDPGNLILTSSTSEAYSFLFKLFGNPGDSFLVPHPGYPLFDHLLELEALKPLPYLLRSEPGWPVDLNSIQKAVQPGCKGLIVINPHNPNGHFLPVMEEKALQEICCQHGLAYISDEVFSDFDYSGHVPVPSNPKTLVFRLGGISKCLGLPQMKLSWIRMEGPSELLGKCKERLELIADTYLSVNVPVQMALENWLKSASSFQRQLKNRVQENYRLLEKMFTGRKGVKVWALHAGWYALLEITSDGVTEEEVVLELLEKHKIFVQPGAFYDFSTGKYLVLSLILESGSFQEGLKRLKNGLTALGL